MSINFTPTLEGYKYTGSFRFWCQKVLPLVYDESLSYYELLCKVVHYLNDVIQNVDGLYSDITELLRAFNQLQNYVNHYFDSLDLQEYVNNKLDEMVEDGTLAEIINVQIFGDLNNFITNVKYWSEPDQYIQAYRDEFCENAVSYLLKTYNSDSVVNNVIPDSQKVCWEYSTNLGYMGLLGRYLKFEYEDTESTEAGTLPVAYADCSVFTSLINKCISYENSPYNYVFTADEIDEKTLFNKCFESGTIRSKPYTYDLLNNYNTSTMAYIQNKCGIGLIPVSTYEWDDTEATFENTEMMETGDMIYRGLSSNNYYRGIGHCGTFIKNLNDLNNADNTPNGVTFKSWNGHTSNIGYILEFTGSSSQDNDYTNCLRITAFEDWAYWHGGSEGWVKLWISKPISCALTSNKAYSEITSVVKCYDFDLNVTQERGVNGEYIIASILPKIAGGLIIKAYDNLNDYVYNGEFQCTTREVKQTLSNAPGSAGFDNFKLICVGFNKDQQYGIQIALGFSITSYQYVAVRVKTQNVWSPWVKVCTLDSCDDDNFGILNARSGLINSGEIAANSYKDVTVTFDTPFTYIPRITLTREIMNDSTTPSAGIYACVVNDNVTTNGFKVRIFNTTGTNFSATYWNWLASKTMTD